LIVSGAASGQQGVIDTGINALRWWSSCKPPREVTSAPLDARVFTNVDKLSGTSNNSPSKPMHGVAWPGGVRVTGENYWHEQASRALDGFLAGMIWGSNFIHRVLAVAMTRCMWSRQSKPGCGIHLGLPSFFVGNETGRTPPPACSIIPPTISRSTKWRRDPACMRARGRNASSRSAGGRE